MVGDQEVIAGPGTITAIDGLTFVVSDELGDIHRGVTGLIVNDTRHLSSMALTVSDGSLQRLGAAVQSQDRVSFHSFAPPTDTPDPALECERIRTARGAGFIELIRLRWWAPGVFQGVVGLELDCDFADIFTVRRPSPEPAPGASTTWHGSRLVLHAADAALRTVVNFSAPPDTSEGPHASWDVAVRRSEPWELTLTVSAEPADTQWVRLGLPDAGSGQTKVASRPDDLERACARSVADLERLTTHDRRRPNRRILTAGIPWFVALFGRDSLIASYQARAFNLRRMVDGLFALAARQGTRHDRANDEEPGKILHEVRLTDRPWLGSGTEGGSRPYYGSVDATPLFIVMLGTACRWGAPRSTIANLLPAAEAALRWMRIEGDRDGDGLIEYLPGGPRSLRNQGWKDSDNAIQFADGTAAYGPIALVEVQAYAYRARRELAEMYAWFGRHDEATEMTDEADRIRLAIRERFWIPGRGREPGYFALALDGDKRPVDAVASNMGHLLWCGVPSNEEAEQVASWLAGPDLASGWGVRTLSRAMCGYNPISYHAGSVWPHDTAIACEGLRRYALDVEAMALAHALLDACAAFDGRLPELFGGHPRDEQPLPVPYPSACRPQAWSAGVPLALIPVFLGLEPACHRGSLSLGPLLPPDVERLRVTGIPFGDEGVLSVEVGADGTRMIETPGNLAIELRPARPDRHRGSRGAEDR